MTVTMEEIIALLTDFGSALVQQITQIVGALVETAKKIGINL